MDTETFQNLNIHLPYPDYSKTYNAAEKRITIERQIRGAVVKFSLTWENDEYARIGFEEDYTGNFNPDIAMLSVAFAEMLPTLKGCHFPFGELPVTRLQVILSECILSIYNTLLDRTKYWDYIFCRLDNLLPLRVRGAAPDSYRHGFYEIARYIPELLLKGEIDEESDEHRTFWWINSRNAGSPSAVMNCYREIFREEHILEDVRKFESLWANILEDNNVDAYGRFGENNPPINVLAPDRPRKKYIFTNGNEIFGDDPSGPEDDDNENYIVLPKSDKIVDVETKDKNGTQNIAEDTSDNIRHDHISHEYDILAENFAVIETIWNTRIPELCSNAGVAEFLGEKNRKCQEWRARLKDIWEKCVYVHNPHEEVCKDVEQAIVEIAKQYPFAFVADARPFQSGIDEILKKHEKQATWSWDLCKPHLKGSISHGPSSNSEP